MTQVLSYVLCKWREFLNLNPFLQGIQQPQIQGMVKIAIGLSDLLQISFCL